MSSSEGAIPRTFISFAVSRAVLWVYAYYAFEWLFFLTKPSVIASSAWPARLLSLLVAPLLPLIFVAAGQLLLAAADRVRPRSERRWIAGLIPGTLASLLLLIALENFVRTVFGTGVADITARLRPLFVASALVCWFYLVRREATALIAGSAGLQRTAAAVCVTASIISLPFCFTGEVLRASTAPRAEVNRRSNILLLGIDGVSAARTSLYGYGRKTTPMIDALASDRGLVFENAFPNAGRTHPSLISMLTGRQATEMHVYAAPSFLEGPASVEHLPGLLRRHGYTTSQIGVRDQADAEDWNMRDGFDEVNGRILRRSSGVSQSTTYQRVQRFSREVEERISTRVLHLTGIREMEDLHEFLTEGARTSRSRFSDQLRMALAREFIQGRREPWLMQIHLLDTHCCDWEFIDYHFARPAELRDARWRADRGDDALRHVDAYVGELIDLLRRTGQLERTMIVIYSDHGLGWDSIDRIPLILLEPGRTESTRVSANVELLDVGPTILAHLGIERPAWMQGRSLLDPSVLDPMHPIYALWEGDEEHLPKPKAEPPFDGARSASLTICDAWVEMLLDGGAVRRQGRVVGHTAPCEQGDWRRTMPAMLRHHLARNGYPVFAPAGEGR